MERYESISTFTRRRRAQTSYSSPHLPTCLAVVAETASLPGRGRRKPSPVRARAGAGAGDGGERRRRHGIRPVSHGPRISLFPRLNGFREPMRSDAAVCRDSRPISIRVSQQRRSIDAASVQGPCELEASCRSLSSPSLYSQRCSTKCRVLGLLQDARTYCGTRIGLSVCPFLINNSVHQRIHLFAGLVAIDFGPPYGKTLARPTSGNLD